MKLKIIFPLAFLFFIAGYSQDSIPKYKWLRSGLVVGYASQNTFLNKIQITLTKQFALNFQITLIFIRKIRIHGRF